ncbi:hypothetical protein SLA2020_190960 [Shorea laevis]
MAKLAPAISQLSCFSSINGRFQLQSRSIFVSLTRSQSFVVMAFDDRGLDSNGSQHKSNLSIGAEESKPFTEKTTKSHVNVERNVPEEFGTILAGVFLWKNIEAYSLPGKIFPAGFYAATSAAMLSFYTYVVISGRNPPPKLSKLAASEQS